MNAALVQVRTPTYRRPRELERALRSIQEQTWSNWVVDVYDDDPLAAGREVCERMGDTRIRYHHNDAQKYASANIDQCFSAANPNDADYFCVVEDDNFLLPRFMEDNVALCRREGVEIVLRNQLVEHASGTPAARLSETGVLDHLLVEGPYQAAHFRMSLLIGIGVSNGGLFWSRNARSKLEIGFDCTATIQEYMRTFSIDEPIYVAMTPLAVWAENAEQTTRNAGLHASYLRRELDLKRRIQALQRLVWKSSPAGHRRDFLDDERFAPGAGDRSKALAKALIPYGGNFGRSIQPLFRGLLIRALGRLDRSFEDFVCSRRGDRTAGPAPSISERPQGVRP
jgi:hypothetical protein